MAFMLHSCSRFAAAILGLSLSVQAAVAGVMPSHSRIIYPQDSPFQSLLLVNTNHFPVVVQLWVNEGETDAAPERADAPFLPTPAMFKLDPSQLKELKVFNTQPERLNDHVEQLYWLNILEVPPTPTANQDEHLVGLAMLTQLKILYRPNRLKASSEAVLAQLQQLRFTLAQDQGRPTLRIDNPSAYVANIAHLAITQGDQTTFSVDTELDKTIRPGAQQTFKLTPVHKPKQPQQGHTLRFILVNDEGQYVPYERRLPPIMP
ncbi:molecular chaperone [Neisseriaceae bacterium CLB008]